MAAKKPLQDPAVPDGAVDGINPANEGAYKGFNFDMGTVNHNITCNSCHAGGGPAQFGRENKPLDEFLKERLGDKFEELKSKDWFVRDDEILSELNKEIPFDGDLFGYSDYEVGAGYIGKPGLFNFARSGVNDTDCFMCHADASQKDKIVHTKLGRADVYPIMPANPRVMVFKGISEDNETIVISLGVPPQKDEVIGGKKVKKVESAYYNSVPLEVLAGVYQLDNETEIANFLDRIRKGEDGRFYLYPNNANGATREVARVAYFEHPEDTKDKDGGDVYVNGGALTFKDDNGKTVYRTFAGFFFKYISTASLMGVDTNQNGVPLAYVRFVKEDGIWKPEVYYELAEFQGTNVDLPILENRAGDKDLPATDVKPEDYTYSVPKRDDNDELKISEKEGVHQPEMTAGSKNREWGYVCSYCHMAIVYPSTEVDSNGDNQTDATLYTWVTRKGTLGLGAEVVKRGDVFSYDLHRGGEDKGNLPHNAFVNVDFSNETQRQQAFFRMLRAKSVLSFDDIPIGYDVHFDSEKAGLTCLSCHGEGSLSTEEKEYHPIHHDFLKGNDWGGHWDQSLDYNPSLKTCIDCHFGGSRSLAAEVHRVKFGSDGNAAIHMEKVACEVCHIPFKTHWTFRTFYDVVGYSYNFDNRILGYNFENETTNPLPRNMFTPGFGPFMPIAGYGAPQPFCIVRTENGKDTLVPIYQADFDPRQAALRLEQRAFGIWNVPGISFPWAWAPVIINNGFRPDTPGGQKFMYRIADPLTLVTWYDKSTGKVLYTREIAAALDGAVKSNYADKNVPAYFIHEGKICVKTIKGKWICDDNGDLLPEIDTDAEYRDMKEAIAEVLRKEGVHNPEPVFYIWTAPFSIDHGVLPKEYALGSGNTIKLGGSDIKEDLGCTACHDAKTGRLPQANMGDIDSSSLKELIERDKDGNVKFFGLGREIVTVPSRIPPEAYREAVRVFFNSPEDENGNPKYGKMNLKVAGEDRGEIDVMYTTAGDILVNALTNGVDIDRHLVPIPVESSGIDGVAFALPGKKATWKMRIEGVETEVETEALGSGEHGEADEVPRRAIVIRLKNELPELLGFEHLADEIMEAGEGELLPVFTPIIPSELISKMTFKLAEFKVADPADLYINYAKIHKERVSEEHSVHYEVDKEHFKPASISVKDAIARGWASYDAAEGTLTVNVLAMAEEVPGKGELAFSLMKKIGAVEIPADVEYPQDVKVEEGKAKVPLKLKFDGEEKEITVNFDGIESYSGGLPAKELYSRIKELGLSKAIFGLKIMDGDERFTMEFDPEGLLSPDRAVAVVIVEKNGEEKTDKCRLKQGDGGKLVLNYPCSRGETETGESSITVVVGEELPTSGGEQLSGGGGGGGCSVAPATGAGNGLLNVGVLLSGLLGLLGFRRKKH